MRHIVLASHGNLAAGMKSSVELIAGAQPGLETVCAYTEECPTAAEPLAVLVKGLAEGDELIIVTDVLGGSVNNEASQFVNEPGVYVVTGMNLAFVLSLVVDAGTPTAELIGESVAEAREQLRRMDPVPDADEDDF